MLNNTLRRKKIMKTLELDYATRVFILVWIPLLTEKHAWYEPLVLGTTVKLQLCVIPVLQFTQLLLFSPHIFIPQCSVIESICVKSRHTWFLLNKLLKYAAGSKAACTWRHCAVALHILLECLLDVTEFMFIMHCATFLVMTSATCCKCNVLIFLTCIGLEEIYLVWCRYNVSGCTNASKNKLSNLVGCYAMSAGKQWKTFLRHYAALIQQSAQSHVSSPPISEPKISHKHINL